VCYDDNAPLLAQQGYFSLPISPPGFEPPKCPVRFEPGLNKYVKLTNWNNRPDPIRAPQPGANIGVRCGGGLVAFDYDDEDAALTISEAFEPSPVNKAGKRAWTPFYRADFEVLSEDFFDAEGRKVLQILSAGRQTVIPPSIHPDTKEPYRWTNGHSLYDTPLSELPLLPKDYRERIERLGYTSKKSKPTEETIDPETGEIKDVAADDWRALNNAALKNLAAWVPNLNLYKCRRRVGRYPNYEAVANWRESTTGKTLEERTPNLKISSTGIKDFGNDQGYTAIDLVMAARGIGAGEAFTWLEERLRPKQPDIEIDLEKIKQAQDAPPLAPEGVAEGGTGSDDYEEMEKDLEVVGRPWFVNEELPEPKPMMVPYFVPSHTEPCIGYVGAVTGSVKTFTVDDLAVAIASGGLFAGQQVSERGAVVLIEMEGSSRVRLKASIQYRGVEEIDLPIMHIQKMPPPILQKGEVSKEWKDWCMRIVRLAQWQCQRRWGVPLTTIILDPLAHFSGITDIGNFAENTTVSKALIDLALKARCLVIIVDHYGKDTTRGLIGSIARESLAYFVLTPGEKLGADLSKPRQLVVRKMRDGMSSICVDYRIHVWDIKAKRVVEADNFDLSLEEQARRTLVIEWGKDVRRWGEGDDDDDADGDSLSSIQRIVLNKLNELLNTEGTEPAECGAPAGLKAILLSRLWPPLRAKGLSMAGVTRARTELLAKGLIGIHGDWIWITLGIR
jgi:hypothetical protein